MGGVLGEILFLSLCDGTINVGPSFSFPLQLLELENELYDSAFASHYESWI